MNHSLAHHISTQAYNNAWANHRGQVHAMLAGTNIEPPQLDEFFSSGEAHLRAHDFAQLGWTESQVWGAR